MLVRSDEGLRLLNCIYLKLFFCVHVLMLIFSWISSLSDQLCDGGMGYG